jgi:hypothetical protein
MSEQRIQISKEDFDNGKIPDLANHVLVEMVQSNDYRKSKGGIIVGLVERVIDTADDSNIAADLEEVWGVVAKVPTQLDFTTMDWETEMELRVGDQCYFGIIEAHNAIEIVCEDKLYKLLPYSDIYVAKRYPKMTPTDVLDEYKKGNGVYFPSKVIVLNGYILAQTINRTKIHELDVVSEDQIDTTKCVIKYIGKPNKSYKNANFVDIPNLKVDDVVMLAPRTPFQYLERKTYLSSFNGDNLYIVIPRRKIIMVL